MIILFARLCPPQVNNMYFHDDIWVIVKTITAFMLLWLKPECWKYEVNEVKIGGLMLLGWVSDLPYREVQITVALCGRVCCDVERLQTNLIHPVIHCKKCLQTSLITMGTHSTTSLSCLRETPPWPRITNQKHIDTNPQQTTCLLLYTSPSIYHLNHRHISHPHQGPPVLLIIHII